MINSQLNYVSMLSGALQLGYQQRLTADQSATHHNTDNVRRVFRQYPVHSTDPMAVTNRRRSGVYAAPTAVYRASSRAAITGGGGPAFVMTINKAQGQTQCVAVLLNEAVFSHGQLYVASSRTSKSVYRTAKLLMLS